MPSSSRPDVRAKKKNSTPTDSPLPDQRRGGAAVRRACRASTHGAVRRVGRDVVADLTASARARPVRAGRGRIHCPGRSTAAISDRWPTSSAGDGRKLQPRAVGLLHEDRRGAERSAALGDRVADQLEHFVRVARAQDRGVGGAQRREHVGGAAARALGALAFGLQSRSCRARTKRSRPAVRAGSTVSRFSEWASSDVEQEDADAGAVLQDRHGGGGAIVGLLLVLAKRAEPFVVLKSVW